MGSKGLRKQRKKYSEIEVMKKYRDPRKRDFVQQASSRLVASLLQACYKACCKLVTGLLQACYRLVTRLVTGLLQGFLQDCYRLAAGLLQACCRLVTGLLQACYKACYLYASYVFSSSRPRIYKSIWYYRIVYYINNILIFDRQYIIEKYI